MPRFRVKGFLLLPVAILCLAFLSMPDDAAARASGSTRLTIRLEQGVPELLALRSGQREFSAGSRASIALAGFLPRIERQLLLKHRPADVSRLIRGLAADTLLVIDGEALLTRRDGGNSATFSELPGQISVLSF